MGPVARRGRYISGLVLVVVVGALFALACLGGIIGAASTAGYRARNQETFGGDIALAVVSAVIVAVCILAGAHLEHQLRRHHAVAQSWTGARDPGATSGELPRIATRRRGRYSPLTLAIYLVVMIGVSIGLAVGAVFVHSDGRRSALVQHHGIPRVATVAGVQNHYHSSRGGGYYTADIYVSFAPPYRGRTQTFVHYPGRVQAPAGTQMQVLIDPTDPAYAELPGSPATKTWAWILMAIFAVLFAGLDLFVGWVFLRLWRHGRSFARMGSSPATVSA
jgi:hypothetical protein